MQRLLRLTALAIFGLVMLTVLTLKVCQQMDTFESNYNDLSAATKDGAVQRGWVPDFLPASAFQIHERHNISTNEVWMSFGFGPKDTDFLSKSCTRVPPDKIALPRGFGKWWPASLTPGSPQLPSYDFYRCADTLVDRAHKAVGWLAIDAYKSIAYYWEGAS